MRVFIIVIVGVGAYSISEGYISGEMLHHIEYNRELINDKLGGH